jgi:beta-N-acetylhexosaminidase
MGHARADPHHELTAIEVERSVLEEREFVPFRAAIDAGARLAMIGHLAVPTVTGRADLPATLARAIVTDLLRDDFGFEGVTISDALDMHAIAQGEGQASAVVEAIRAGIDLLLTTPDPGSRVRIEAALVRAATNGAFDAAEVRTGDARLASLRSWLGAAGPLPDLSVVRHADHLALAREVAERAVTLVRDPGRIVGGLSPDADDPRPVLAIMPRPTDLTPADTSSTVPAGLAVALRRYHRAVEEIVVDPAPDQAAIDAVRGRVAGSRAVVAGTLDAIRHPGQVALVEAIAAAAVGSGIPAVAVALRGPWDVAAYPGSMAALATYSILPDSLAALAAVLAGASTAGGRLPVAIAR